MNTIPVLCDELGITVNEFLCGEKLDGKYKEQADDNIMDVFAVNKNINKQKLLCDILTGAGIGIILGAEFPRYEILGTGIRVYFPALRSALIFQPNVPKGQDEPKGLDSLTHSAVDIDISLEQLTEILDFCNEPRTRKELQEFCGYKSPSHFRERILTPLLKGEQLILTIPEKPNSPKQKYIRRAVIKA